MPIPIIIDTDPGIDDAAAISLALHHPQLDVQLISTVHGNVPLQRTTRNAQQLIEHFHAHVPVASGAASPLVQKAVHAPHVHGESGMAGYTFDEPTTSLMSKNSVEAMKDLLLQSTTPITLVPIGPHVHGESGMAGYTFDEPTTSLMSKNSVEAMKDLLLQSTTPITLVPIGPLTNIALLLKMYPEVHTYIHQIVLMGGSVGNGNVSVAAEFNVYADPEALTNIALLLKMYPEVHTYIHQIVLMGGSVGNGNVSVAAEFNVYADPEAAHIVFNSNLPIVMAGLDIARASNLPHVLLPKIKEMNHTGHMLYHLFQHYRGESFLDGLNVYDAYTIMYLCYPELFTVRPAKVDVELSMLYHLFQHYRGESFLDGLNVYDAYTIMYLCYPELFTVRPAKVDVELSGSHARGATFVDFNVTDSSTHVLMDIQAEAFQTAFLDMLKYCP